MEAATASGAPLLTRDGAIPATPQLPPSSSSSRQPIDGVAQCVCCDRFPLIGERVVRHVGRRRSGWVCESCEATGRGDRVGTATEIDRIHSLGGAMNVRRAG